MRLRLQEFSGVAPKISRQLLPDNMARDARNCRLLSGELRGLHALTPLHTFEGQVRSAVRVVKTGTQDEVWIGFPSEDVDFVKGPLVNDAHSRYYWTGDSTYNYMAYSPLARIEAGDPAYRLGVPTPTAPLTVAEVTAPLRTLKASGRASLAPIYARGAVGAAELSDPPSPAVRTGTSVDPRAPAPIIETRAYIYTFVNELGEESAPSEPFLWSGPAAGTWELAGISITPTDMNNRCPVVKRRVYRTVTGQASALFYFVADIDNMTDTTYTDDRKSSDVVQRNICNTFNWDCPPDDLKGLTAHPAGFFAAFKGREIYLSEPYRPWAWPVEYILAIEHDIVGLAIYGNMLMVMTTSTPYFLAGTHPSNLSPQRSQSVEPCLSKRGIVATIQGVLYPSPNGLVVFNEGGAQIATNPLLSRDEWIQQFTPRSIKAAQRGLSYIAFRDGSTGFIFSPGEPLGALSTLDRFVGVDNVLTDRNSGRVFILSQNTVYEWDNPTNVPVYYTWRSKEFDMPRPLNFGACIIKMEGFDFQPPDNDMLEEQRVWNQSRITRPLNPLGYTSLGGSRWRMTPTLGEPNFNDSVDFETGGYDRRRYPFGGSPLFPTGVNVLPTGFSAILRVFADRRLVASLTVVPNQIMRLPSGFKAHLWQFELVSNIPVYSIAVAETAKQLMDV